ncbi:ferritin-like domain-containing protein [Dactylosporangium salmoneum]|uniref:Ferritin-like domain-containing protein n=1 Tax=Dactylosporangium salmoneum TaxID=53361 RepID=A0ABP5SNF1_9ACTN
MPPVIDLDGLGLDGGAHLLIDRALGALRPGEPLRIRGHHPALAVHLAAWCRSEGHRYQPELTVVKGAADAERWAHAERAGQAAATVAERAKPEWGLAARSALVEPGGPPLDVDWAERDHVWTDIAPQLYAQATASQWNPATAVRWDGPHAVPPDIEDAVVQIMTYLVENEQAALMIPARMLSRLHPHYREVMQLLAAQAADEARHVEIFTRRALLHREVMGVSGAGGRSSLQSLLDEPDFTLAAFLLSVLGEGSFLDLLRFIQRHAPDGATADVAMLAARDEARHVAFGVAHTAHVVRSDRAYLGRLRDAVHRRHSALADTAGLNHKVFDSLVVLAAGAWTPAAIARGWQEVQRLQQSMDEGRRRRLEFIGFPAGEAAAISALHTRNFM